MRVPDGLAEKGPGYEANLEDARYSKWLQLHKLSRPTAGIPSVLA